MQDLDRAAPVDWTMWIWRGFVGSCVLVAAVLIYQKSQAPTQAEPKRAAANRTGDPKEPPRQAKVEPAPIAPPVRQPEPERHAEPPPAIAIAPVEQQAPKRQTESNPKAAGRRQLPSYEADVYGPLPFSEEVTGFLEHELHYFLKRQNKDGSWDSAEPIGGGRSRTEAGGTVDNITLTSMCGVSLRKHIEIDPQVFEDSIGHALRFVTSAVSSGKLRNNVSDAPWRYVYALRFLIHEYPHVADAETKKQVEDACAFLVQELKDIQQGTPGQRAVPFNWNRRSSPGMVVDDTADCPGIVVRCEENTPAFQAGVRPGDRLLMANGTLVDSALRYAMSELNWYGGETVEFTLSREGAVSSIRVPLPNQYPGTLGLEVGEDSDGLVLKGFEFLSNPTDVPLQVGDRILKVDQQSLAKASDLDKLALHAGQEVEMVVARDGKSQTFKLVCAPIPAANFGVRISRSLDQGTESGFRIEELQADSCLRTAGLRRGDRLLRLDGSLILNRRHFKQLGRSLWAGKKVQVTYLSGGQTKQVEVTPGSLPNRNWLVGFHGINITDQGEAVVTQVDARSPAGKARLRRGDQIVEVNGARVTDGKQAQNLFTKIAAGNQVAVSVQRDGTEMQLSYVAKRRTDSVWLASSEDAGGGWEYYSRIRGGSTFLTSDALRELLVAKRVMPKLDIPEEMLFRAFWMLTKLRKKQPNSGVESYRYDAGGSFWRVEDIRGDVGRLNSAELACLMYSDTSMKDEGQARTQSHLEKTLEEWLKHRGILDLVKFPAGHSTYSIAPYFWMYSYRTTLEAADYLTANDDLKERVRRIALKAFFKHMEFRYEEVLGEKGWIIGIDHSKELHDSCQLLDGLATMKHLYQPRLKITQPEPKQALDKFNATQYGEAYRMTRAIAQEGGELSEALAREIKLLQDAIANRFDARLADVKAIQKENSADGLYHLEQMKKHFQGYPRLTSVSRD